MGETNSHPQQGIWTGTTTRPRHSPSPRIGLALSCGGAKALAHVGVIQVLEENNIEIAAVSGSSMGAYIGALWCAGFNGAKLGELAAEMEHPKIVRQLADLAIPPLKGLFHGRKAKAHLGRSIGDITFEELIRPLLVITADLDTKERIVCRSGSVLDAVHASCAMPGVVVPVRYCGRRCTDGGVVDPLPVGALHTFSGVDYVIAVSTLPTFDDLAKAEPEEDPPPPPRIWQRFLTKLNRSVNLLAYGNAIDTMRSSLKAAQIRMTHESRKRADIFIHPASELSNWYDYHQYPLFIERGRRAAENALPDILSLAANLRQNNHELSQTDMVGNGLQR